MIELEKKVLLTKAQYQFLCTYLHWDSKTVICKNYYFDTEDLFWSRRGVTCRIREGASGFLATVKIHGAPETELSWEASQTVKNHLDTSWFHSIGMTVSLQGISLTHRTKFFPQKGIEVSLDQSISTQVTDYELEIEYSIETQKRADTLLEELSCILFQYGLCQRIDELVILAGKHKSKSQRCLQQLKKEEKRT